MNMQIHEDILYLKEKTEYLLKKLRDAEQLSKKDIQKYFDVTGSIQKNAESICLKARLLPLKTGHPQAKTLICENSAHLCGIKIDDTLKNWIYIEMPVLLPKKETSGVQYIRDSLNFALLNYFKNRERSYYKETAIMIFNHCYSEARNYKIYRDHDNIEINAVSDLLALNFLYDDSPAYCQHFHYTTINDKDMTKIYVVPISHFKEWLSDVYVKDIKNFP